MNQKEKEDIIKRYKNFEHISDIAKIYNVSHSTIRLILWAAISKENRILLKKLKTCYLDAKRRKKYFINYHNNQEFRDKCKRDSLKYYHKKQQVNI